MTIDTLRVKAPAVHSDAASRHEGPTRRRRGLPLLPDDSTTSTAVKGLSIVTGAANGIGSVVAHELAAAGYELALFDVDEAGLRRVAAEIGGSCRASVLDVTDAAAAESAINETTQVPRHLVQCAGVIRPSPLLDADLADWSAVLGINLTGSLIVARAVARRMKEAGGGSIVNIASIGGLTAGVNNGAYGVSKAGVIILTEQMALEWAPYGIRVNAIAPGMIDAGMGTPINADSERRRRRDEMIPLGRQGTAHDVAASAVFLGSDAAAYITGHTLVVDGGLTKSLLARTPSQAHRTT